jgi:hypothetical protein
MSPIGRLFAGWLRAGDTRATNRIKVAPSALASAVNSKCPFLRSWTRFRRFNHGFWRCGWAPRLACALIVAVVAVTVLSYEVARIVWSKWIPAKTNNLEAISADVCWRALEDVVVSRPTPKNETHLFGFQETDLPGRKVIGRRTDSPLRSGKRRRGCMGRPLSPFVRKIEVLRHHRKTPTPIVMEDQILGRRSSTVSPKNREVDGVDFAVLRYAGHLDSVDRHQGSLNLYETVSGGLRQSVSVAALLLHSAQLIPVEANHLIGLIAGSLHLVELSPHNIKLSVINQQSAETDEPKNDLAPEGRMLDPMDFFRKIANIAVALGGVTIAIFSHRALLDWRIRWFGALGSRRRLVVGISGRALAACILWHSASILLGI